MVKAHPASLEISLESARSVFHNTVESGILVFVFLILCSGILRAEDISTIDLSSAVTMVERDLFAENILWDDPNVTWSIPNLVAGARIRVESPFPRTYTFRIAIPRNSYPEPVLHIPVSYQAIQVFQGGRLIYRYGEYDTHGVIPWPPHVIRLDPASREQFVYLRIFSRVGYIGLGVPSLTSRSTHLETILKRNWMQAALSPIFFVAGAISIVAFFRMNRERVFLWFGLLALLIGAYSISNRIMQIQHILYDSPLFWYTTEFISLASLPLFAGAFFRSILPFRKTIGLLIATHCLFIITAIGMHLAGRDFLDLLFPDLYLTLVSAVILQVLVIIEAIRGNREMRIILVGTLFFLFCVAHDAFVFAFSIRLALMAWTLVQLAPVGFLVYLLFLGYIVGHRYVEEKNKAQQLRIKEQLLLIHAYERFVPESFMKLLEKRSIIEVSLGDSISRSMTVMFSDIRSFTDISESLTPSQNFSFLNDYLRRMGPCIRDGGGFIDKYIGDAIMALFPNNCEDALRAAIRMRKLLLDYNRERIRTGLAPIETGTGIHYGSVILGTIGEDERMEGTVISDTVNLASRLEGLTKHYGAAIVVSQPFLDEMTSRDEFSVRSLGRVRVKGKSDAVSIFEVFDGDADEQFQLKSQTRNEFEAGLQSFLDRDFARAEDVLSAVVAVNPRDKAAHLILARSAHLEKTGVPPDWEPVETMLAK